MTILYIYSLDDYILYIYSLDDYVHVLEKEVNIDFCRSMNKIIFDKTVTSEEMVVPELGGSLFPHLVTPEVVFPKVVRHICLLFYNVDIWKMKIFNMV